MTTARITYMRARSQKGLIIASAYRSYDVNLSSPTKEMRDVINCSRSGRNHLIVDVMSVYAISH
jgi:hypothetical protein